MKIEIGMIIKQNPNRMLISDKDMGLTDLSNLEVYIKKDKEMGAEISILSKLLLLVANVKLADNVEIDVITREDISKIKKGVVKSDICTLYINRYIKVPIVTTDILSIQ